jgi:VWFA-related protein
MKTAKGHTGLSGLLIFAVFFLAPSLTPGELPRGQETLTKPLQYEVAVTLKLIQVYVTDKSGRPVRDLAKDDFALYDNGKPVVITDFEKYDLAEAPAGPVATVPETKPASTPANSPTINRKFIVLFDFAFNTHKGVAAGIKAALGFLDANVGSEDETALISYSALKGLKVHEFLTTDRATVRKAVASLSAKDIAGRADEVEQAYWQLVELSQSELADAGDAEKELQRMEWQRQESTRQAQNYFHAMTRLAQALRLVQGQKNVLFFSSGVPASLVNSTRTVAGSNLRQSGEGAPGSTFEIGNSELRTLQETMLKEFSAANCSIYSFDTRETAMVASLFARDEMKFDKGLGVSGGPFRDDKTTGMDSLRRLSRQTGGKYYSNIIRYEKSFEEVDAVTAAYYVLGFPVRSAADGKFHGIKVEVKRKGCQVRAQPGYFDPKPFREYTDLEKDIHLFGLALNEKSDFLLPKALAISAFHYASGPGHRVRAMARVPREVWSGLGGKKVELVALFFDAQDNLLSLQRTAVDPGEYKGRDILFTAGAAPRPGVTKCRVIIRDLDTGRSAVASAKAYSPAPGGPALMAHSPLVVVEREGPYLLEGVVKGASESPSWREIFPYDLSKACPVLEGEIVEAAKVGVIVPYSASGALPANVMIKANLVNSVTGQDLAIPFELKESSRRGGGGTLRFDLSLDGVPPGSYLLYIHLADKASGAQTSAHVSLRILR